MNDEMKRTRIAMQRLVKPGQIVKHDRCDKEMRNLVFTGLAGQQFELLSMKYCENCRVLVKLSAYQEEYVI